MTSRRRFLSGAGSVLLFLREGVGRVTAGTAPAASSADLLRLERLFREPPLSARPLTRWWWFGGAVTPEEITRELTFMREAGLGGAEIQPLYPVEVDDAAARSAERPLLHRRVVRPLAPLHRGGAAAGSADRLHARQRLALRRALHPHEPLRPAPRRADARRGGTASRQLASHATPDRRRSDGGGRGRPVGEGAGARPRPRPGALRSAASRGAREERGHAHVGGARRRVAPLRADRRPHRPAGEAARRSAWKVP